VQWVSNVAYGGTNGPAGEMTALKQLRSSANHQWYNETRTFNVRGQLTAMTASGVVDPGYTTLQSVLAYGFSQTANDGRITSRVPGERRWTTAARNGRFGVCFSLGEDRSGLCC